MSFFPCLGFLNGGTYLVYDLLCSFCYLFRCICQCSSLSGEYMCGYGHFFCSQATGFLKILPKRCLAAYFAAYFEIYERYFILSSHFVPIFSQLTISSSYLKLFLNKQMVTICCFRWTTLLKKRQ